MADRAVVVFADAADLAERTAEALASLEGVSVDGATAPADLDRLDGADCVVCRTADGRTPMELLGAVRERYPVVPVVLAVAPEDRPVAEALAGETTAVAPDEPGPLRERVGALLSARDAGPDVAADSLAAVLDVLPNPVVVADLSADAVVRDVNSAFEEAFGYDEDAVVGRPAGEVLLPSGGADELVDPPAADGAVVERRVTRETADGLREFLLRGTRIRVGDRPRGLVVYTDVTEHHRRARRVKALHGTTRDLLVAEDREEIAGVAVEAAEAVLGLPAASVKLLDESGDRLESVAYNEAVEELFGGHPPPFERGEGSVWEVLETGEPRVVRDVAKSEAVDPRIDVESILILPLGEHGVLLSSSPDPHAFDEPAVDLGRLLAANTEAALDRAAGEAALRERERELRAERDRLAALFENVPIPAARAEDVDGLPTVREVNAEFEAVFGYDAEEIVGEPVVDWLVPDGHGELHDEATERARAGEPVEVEVQRRTASGLRDFLLTIAPFAEPARPDRPTGAYAFYIDITERQQRQQRLRVLSRVLRHDIRNQMNVIAGHAKLIADRAADTAVETPAERIRTAADRLLGLSRKTRAAERAVAAAAEQEAVDLGAAVREVVSGAGDRYPGCEFPVESPETRVEVPRSAVVAVEEAIENAAEHNDAPDPTVSTRIATDGEYATVLVADDGPGLPADEVALVEGEREPTQVDHASGVGLWVLSWITAGIGGDVEFADREEGGTEVRLRFPLLER